MKSKMLFLHVAKGDYLFVNAISTLKDTKVSFVIYTNCTRPLEDGERDEDRIASLSLDSFQTLIDQGKLIPVGRKETK